jgi:hypothetical protein
MEQQAYEFAGRLFRWIVWRHSKDQSRGSGSLTDRSDAARAYMASSNRRVFGSLGQ